MAGLLLAVIAGLLAMLALRQAVPKAEPTGPATRPVVMARQNIAARQIVTLDALETRNLAMEDIPSGAIFRVEDAVGKFTLEGFQVGQPLLVQNLIAPPSGPGSVITSSVPLAQLLPPDKVGVVLPADDLMSKSGDVRIGDHVDILASIMVAGKEGGGGQVTLMNLQRVPIVKVLEEVQPAAGSAQANQSAQRPKITGLVLAVDAQDAVILKYFVDQNAKVSIDLRSPKLTVVFDVSPVTLDYLADKYRIKVPKPLESR